MCHLKPATGVPDLDDFLVGLEHERKALAQVQRSQPKRVSAQDFSEDEEVGILRSAHHLYSFCVGAVVDVHDVLTGGNRAVVLGGQLVEVTTHRRRLCGCDFGRCFRNCGGKKQKVANALKTIKTSSQIRTSFQEENFSAKRAVLHTRQVTARAPQRQSAFELS